MANSLRYTQLGVTEGEVRVNGAKEISRDYSLEFSKIDKRYQLRFQKLNASQTFPKLNASKYEYNTLYCINTK